MALNKEQGLNISELLEATNLTPNAIMTEFGLSLEEYNEIEAGKKAIPQHINNSLKILTNFTLQARKSSQTETDKGEAQHTRVGIIEHLRNYVKNNCPTKTYLKNDIHYYVNDFWTSKQRQSNRIHEISYRACFKAELPAFFIDKLTKPGDIVLDPFMGRGTTLVQSSILGRIPYGNDINPLSKMLVVPRLNPPHLEQISERLSEIRAFAPPYPIESHDNELLVFYHPHVLAELLKLRDWFIDRTATGVMDSIDEWIRMVALNRLTGHSTGFFSVYTLPPNQATSIARQKKINAKRQQSPEFKDIYAIVLKKSKSLLSQYNEKYAASDFLVSTGKASNLTDICDDKISLIVTSPPFLDIVDYAQDNWLRAWFGGFSIESVDISIHKKPADWTNFVRECLSEFCRVLKPGGHIAFEVGEVRNGTILLEDLVVKAAHGLPLKIHGVMINDQKFFKTSNSWGVSNNTKGTNTNRIVIMEKI